MSTTGECCGWKSWAELAGWGEDVRPDAPRAARNAAVDFLEDHEARSDAAMPTLEDVRAARERIEDAIVRTPVVPALALSDRLPGPLHLKLENLQRTGSFKDRGALNRLLALTPEERARGVVTASAGNHAQAVA